MTTFNARFSVRVTAAVLSFIALTACRWPSPSELESDTPGNGQAPTADDDPITPPPPPAPGPPYAQIGPSTLESTGLYANFAARTLAPGVVAYAPRFPLYSDGTAKSRFILLPTGDGAKIDPADVELWRFPVGTKIWKEFRSGAKAIETRYLEKRTDQWVFGTFVWNDAQTEAKSWAGAEIPAAASVPVETASGGTQTASYAIPSYEDCLTCHKQHGNGVAAANRPDPVLGFQAVQLERSVIEGLVQAGTLASPSLSWDAHAIYAEDERERQVIGYMHANCGHCHNPRRNEFVPPAGGDPFALNYNLATATKREDVLFLQLVDRPIVNTNVVIPTVQNPTTIKPGKTKDSMLYFRMTGAEPAFLMPKVGVHSKDYGFIREKLKPWIKDLD